MALTRFTYLSNYLRHGFLGPARFPILLVGIYSKNAFQHARSGCSPSSLSVGFPSCCCSRALLCKALYHANEDGKVTKDGPGMFSEDIPTLVGALPSHEIRKATRIDRIYSQCPRIASYSATSLCSTSLESQTTPTHRRTAGCYAAPTLTSHPISTWTSGPLASSFL